MSSDAVWKAVALAAAVAAAAAWLFAGHEAAQAGDTLGAKYCLSSPRTCRYVYSPEGQNLVSNQRSFHVWDWRVATGWDASHEAALDYTEFVWSKTVGPQALVEPNPGSPALPATSNFLYSCFLDGNPQDICTGEGVAAGVCSNTFTAAFCTNVPINIVLSEIYIREDTFSQLSAQQQRAVMSHEMGHTLGLWHHLDPGCLMDATVGLDAPTACDLGFADPIFLNIAPCDGETSGYGIRCIYQWWREQGPAFDCHDLDRNGQVTVPGDILTAILAYNKPAGEPGYHPDADVNKDGAIDVPNDILQIILQYNQYCAVSHYPHS